MLAGKDFRSAKNLVGKKVLVDFFPVKVTNVTNFDLYILLTFETGHYCFKHKVILSSRPISRRNRAKLQSLIHMD